MIDPMMQPASEGVIEREVRIAAPPNVVWAFWTDPGRIVRWMGKTATLDPRAGGSIRIDYGSGNVMLGEVVELDPPRRLVFTWGWEDPAEVVRPGGSRVEVDLVADGEGTRLRLRHSGLPDGEVAGHAEGWDYFLGRLAGAAADPDAAPG
jgi:uncharacterized protein YndB with AHSA1/START domain